MGLRSHGPRLCSAALRAALRPGHETYFTSSQPPSVSGRNACSAEMVETSL
ncbi:hypothetical protein ABIC03_006423 [Bradyrhizobium sp. RT6a]